MNTVSSAELSTVRMVAGNENKYSRVIHDGVVKNWVGFAWVIEGEATDEDRKNYPTVVEEGE